MLLAIVFIRQCLGGRGGLAYEWGGDAYWEV